MGGQMHEAAAGNESGIFMRLHYESGGFLCRLFATQGELITGEKRSAQSSLSQDTALDHGFTHANFCCTREYKEPI